MPNQLVFLCGARDFHAMDWYKSAKELLIEKDIYILTDLIAGEGYKKLICEKDKIVKLIILDRLLLKKQSKLGNLWRNIIKLLVFPFQVLLIKKFSKKHPDAIYHAHSMYYLLLAKYAGIKFVGTPQGSDILIKPFSSKIFKYFAVKSLKAAKAITVDSNKMKEKVFELAGVEAKIIQNGIDIDTITNFINTRNSNSTVDKTVLSIRGLTPLYRIKEIVMARNVSSKISNIPITFIYPFYEEIYLNEISPCLKPFDKNVGRLDRIKMYELLADSKLVISIPFSDSSPRSVYEAIFCGCIVAITYNTYYDILPQCMKSRIVLVDLNDEEWFDKAMEKSYNIEHESYIPSDDALNMFDQRLSFRAMEKLLFN